MFFSLFPRKKIFIGMVHLLPLPGSFSFKGSISKVLERALFEAKILEEEGADGLIVENFGDAPFKKEKVGPEVVSAMTAIVWEIKRKVKIPIGVNVLRNDALSAMAIASISGADFIRVNVLTGAMVTDQGIIEGKASKLLSYRNFLGSKVLIFADVLVKHAFPLGGQDISQVARETYYRGKADGLVVSGKETGKEAEIEKVKIVKRTLPNVPLLIGSGITKENVLDYLKFADGVIVGTSLKKEGKVENIIDRKRLREILQTIHH